MTYWLRVGLMALATLCALGSATLLFRARNDRADVTGLPVFFLEPLFPAGRRLRKLLKRKDRSSRDRYRKLLELYAPGEADRIRRQAMDAGYTYLLLLIPAEPGTDNLAEPAEPAGDLVVLPGLL